MRNYALAEETLAYVTAESPSNTDPRNLVSGSQNVLIDRQRKAKSRGGYARLGVANDALTPIRNAATWNTSTGTELPIRFYDDEMEVYLGTIDGTVIDAWTRVKNGLSTTLTPRAASWFDAVENIDLFLFVMGDVNIYEWNGAVAVVDSITAVTVTKAGANTFAQNRFYAARNMTFFCVRTGTEYTYTGGAATLTLTGIADTTGLIAGDVLIQKLITDSSKPSATRINDTILVFENQLLLGSFTDNEVFISQNDDYDDFTYSAPRVSGEGALLTLDGPSGGLGVVGKNLVAFAGRNSVFSAKYTEIAVSTTLAETLSVKKLDTGVNQSSQSPDAVVPVGDSLLYLSHEPALREISNPDQFVGVDPKTLSNPIKPDFDGEDWTGAKAIWDGNALYLSAPVSIKTYVLEFVEDADGKLRRFWQPPQILPVNAFSIIDGRLHGHSSAVPETYKLFDGYSDVNSTDESLPINAIAKYAYNSFGKRGLLKTFDEYFVEGEIGASTDDVEMDLLFDWNGSTQTVTKTIDGTDEDILEDTLSGSGLGQVPLGQEPLGGSSQSPPDARKFRVVFEMPGEDFSELQTIFSVNNVDRYFAIISHGPNVALAKRRNSEIRK